MSWIDIIFIAILVLFGIAGLWKGLLDSILGLATSLVSIIIAIWGAKPVATFIRKIVDVDSLFYKWLGGFFNGEVTKTVFGISLTREKLSAFLTVALSAVLIFILIRLTVLLISKLFDSATASNSALSGLNRVFGLVFGVAKGLLINCLILAGCYIVISTGLASNLDGSIKNTNVTNLFYKYTANYVSEKLSGSKVQSIVDDMEIPQRAEEHKNCITTDTDHWQIKNNYSNTDESTFKIDENGSYILYYDNSGTSTSVILTSPNVTIQYFSGETSDENPFTLGADETSKVVTIKVIYSSTASETLTLNFDITINKSE